MKLLLCLVALGCSSVGPSMSGANRESNLKGNAQLGPRPFFLVDQMRDSDLKRELASCAAETEAYTSSPFSIGHRGAPLQFPEHTKESYTAAARMGAGIIECDVTFTSDLELVCRHAQCDLHTTTNILATPLAAKCAENFLPAQFHPITGERLRAASAKCCTSDITLNEFRTLHGKMDGANANATTVEAYLNGTPEFRTELYSAAGTLLSHAESIELFKALGTQMAPELKSPQVPMPFNGLTRTAYAQKMIDEYQVAGVSARDVHPQSFNLQDVLFWINKNPDFGERAVYLDGRDPVSLSESTPSLSEFQELKALGVQVIATPISALLALSEGGEIEPSLYATRAREAGLDIIGWTTERSGRVLEDIVPSGGGFYYNTIHPALKRDGDLLLMIDILAQQVGLIGLFSDWAATTTFYANCKELPRLRSE